MMTKKLNNKSVLVIDDDTRMLRALDKVLTGEGAVVTRASWAGDAMDILNERKQTFDLVITDLRMPFVTGLTVVFAVHKIYPALPVIVLTAFGSPEVKAECLRQGASAILEKPLDTPALLAVVGKVFAAQPDGPEPGETGRAGKNDFTDENNEPENPGLNARQTAAGRQDYDQAAGAGGTGRRKEKYEYR